MLENSLKKIRFVNYFLAVFLLFALLLLIRNIVTVSFTQKGTRIEAPEPGALDTMARKDIMQYSAILEKNPFGAPMKLRPITVEQKAESRFGSISDLILIGTAVGHGNMSYAIFEDKSPSSTGKQEVFAYGAEVFNYGVLKSIDSSSVEIERDSTRYKLTIPFEKIINEPEQREARGTEEPEPQDSFARKVGEREYVLDSRRVQQSLENPEQILTDARLLPNIVDGRQEGFKISEVVPDGLYHSLGLRNGDVLLRVNGLEISNPEVAMQAMTALKGMNKVNLDVIRNGSNMSMSYQIR